MGTSGQWANGVGAVTLADGLNSDVVITTSYVRISGPTRAFSIGGFAGPQDGTILRVYNSTPQQMTIANEDTASAVAHRIKTLIGADVVLRKGTSAAHFIYDSTDARWILMGAN